MESDSNNALDETTNSFSAEGYLETAVRQQRIHPLTIATTESLEAPYSTCVNSVQDNVT